MRKIATTADADKLLVQAKEVSAAPMPLGRGFLEKLKSSNPGDKVESGWTKISDSLCASFGHAAGKVHLMEVTGDGRYVSISIKESDLPILTQISQS